MDSIDILFDEFAAAYSHSLFAIEQAEKGITAVYAQHRDTITKKHKKEQSRIATETTNKLMANIHRLKDSYKELIDVDDSVIKAADYLAYGEVTPENISKLIFSDNALPWIMPFLGHQNLYIESNGTDSQILGLQFVVHALIQTAPGQLQVTVINPELRPEFSSCSRLPDFKMLTTDSEIKDEMTSLIETIIENDTLIQGKYSSLLELRKVAKQPVGRLQLLIIQDFPDDLSGELSSLFVKIVRGAPRAGISILFLNSRTTKKSDAIVSNLKNADNCFSLVKSGEYWRSSNTHFTKLSYSFPIMTNTQLADYITEITNASKQVSAITIPFNQIEDTTVRWEASSANNLTFNLGKSGLDTVSVCLGDSVTQHHNILISGAAGQGKSNLIEVMIHSLCTRYSPEELQLYLLDFKDGLTFKPYASCSDMSWLPHAKMLGLESDRDVGLAVLKDLESERQNRAVLFGNSDEAVHDYESYRKRYPEIVLPRIVLIIDEYQKLFDINDEVAEEASSLLENLVRQGRACAIHIILASQSITGTAGLLGKEDRIYAQFPIRIALKNTVSESFSIFSMGNDGAAKLRVRGEAIINVNYGAIDSNVKFTVAYADPNEMTQLRHLFCNNRNTRDFPVIFTKKDKVDYSMFIPSVANWRKGISDGRALRLPCGVLLSVNKNVLPITLSHDSGRNVAILGSAEDLQADGAIPGQNNMAIGMLQGFGISIALQHPDGKARFVMIDGLTPETRKNSNIQRWLSLMERLGFFVEIVNAKDASSWLMEFQQEIHNSNVESTYILGFGMDRCSNFTESNLSGESGASAFQELLKLSTEGVHFMCWWSSITTYKNHIGFYSDGYIGTKILLRMDTDTARDILGPFVNWSVRSNRAYIHDSSELATDFVVMPQMPVTNRVCGLIEAEAW